MNEDYRKVWIKHNGEIPRDRFDRSYEIHHINGDSSDNRIENLACYSIQEHYDIHYSQEDYAACSLIATRLNKTQEEISKLASLANKKRVEDGTHHLLGGKIQTKTNLERVKNGTHHLLGGKIISAHWEEVKKDAVKYTERCAKNSHPGNGKNFNSKGMVSVVDRNGNTLKITRVQFNSQLGEKGNRNFETSSSFEGRKRKNENLSNNNALCSRTLNRRVPETGFESDNE